MKRTVSLILVILIALAALLPVSVGAELPVSKKSGEWDYYLNDDGESVTICRYYGSEKEVAIPGEIDGYRVARLGSWYEDLGLETGMDHGVFDAAPTEKVTIPDTVTAIGDAAFTGCASLVSVNIPDSVTEIGSYAFERCSALTGVSFPDGVTRVGSNVLGGSAFFKDSSNWEDGVLYCGRHLISVSNDIKGAYIIKPGTLTIADWAFSSCNSLESVEIPDSVKEISYEAFGHCYALKSVKLPKYLEKIGGSAFECCESLGNVTFPDTLKEIGAFAFRYCALIDDVKLPDCLESIGNEVFTDTAFYKNEENRDEDGNLYIGSCLIEIRGDAAEEYSVKPGTRTIAEFAFHNDSFLKELTLPEGLTHISACAFSKCRELKTVDLPASLKKIDYGAFYSCDSLVTVNYAGTEEQWDKIEIVEGLNEALLNAKVIFKRDPVKLLAYSDAEHTKPIEGEFAPGEKVYYVLDCAEGYYATELRIDNTSYIDGECFIPGEGELDIRSTSYLAGDVNNDGKLNARDVISLMKYVIGDAAAYWQYHESPNLDFNRDGKTNAKDVIALMKRQVGRKSEYGGAQKDVAGVRAAPVLGEALFALDGAGAGDWGECKVIRDKAALESVLAGAIEPAGADKEFILSPSEYLASVDDGSFTERTLVAVYTGTSGGVVRSEGAYFVNGTLVPTVSVSEGVPGLDCDANDAHVIILAFEAIAEDQPVAPETNLNYPA